ncbi:MAG TPA: MFS transporter [bacterium]|nr:MFS transporter [bacterium]
MTNRVGVNETRSARAASGSADRPDFVIAMRAGGARPWRTYIESWALPYALIGAAVSGGVPILMPLAVARSGSPSAIGFVMATFNLGSVLAPLCGLLADRYRWHRVLFAGGALVTGGAVAAFPWAQNLPAMCGLAFSAGAGSGAAVTMAYLFVTGTHPRDEWPSRIGAAQLLYVSGQIVGLLAASTVAWVGIRACFAINGLVALVATVPAWRTARLPSRSVHPIPGPRLVRPRLVWHHLRSPFALFLAMWTLALTGSQMFYTVYPVFMARIFRVTPGESSFVYALVVGLSLFLFTPVCTWTNRLGASPMIQIALMTRTTSLLAIAALGYLVGPPGARCAEIAFATLQFAWSILSVSSAACAAHLSPLGEGEGMGFYNAAAAIGGVAGAMIGGVVAALWGYAVVPGVGAASILCALLLNRHLMLQGGARPPSREAA